MRLPEFSFDLRALKRLIWIALAALLVLVAAFGAYYYWDRYVHIGDISPLQKNIQALEKKAQENPNDPDTRLALAEYYIENELYADAIVQAKEVIKAFPDSDGAYFILGLAYTQSNQSNLALEPLMKFADFHRKSEMAKVDLMLEASLFYLGQNYVRLSQPEQAIAVLNEALTITRTDADAMYQLGLAYALQKQDGKAVEQYLKAVLFVPDFTEAYSHMIESYTALGQPDYVLYARGMEAYSKSNFTQARQNLEQVIVKQPDFLAAQLGLGLTYEKLASMQDAKKCYERVLMMDPNNYTAGQALARIKQKEGIN
jgi:tetratricopeptide (TPR) repeat protein